jgi:hypothetical protein
VKGVATTKMAIDLMCHGQGYGSVRLIPWASKREILGLYDLLGMLSGYDKAFYG